jgi:hypothetical protein
MHDEPVGQGSRFLRASRMSQFSHMEVAFPRSASTQHKFHHEFIMSSS